MSEDSAPSPSWAFSCYQFACLITSRKFRPGKNLIKNAGWPLLEYSRRIAKLHILNNWRLASHRRQIALKRFGAFVWWPPLKRTCWAARDTETRSFLIILVASATRFDAELFWFGFPWDGIRDEVSCAAKLKGKILDKIMTQLQTSHVFVAQNLSYFKSIETVIQNSFYLRPYL